MFKVAFKVVCHPKYCFFVQNKLKLDGKNIYWSGRQDIFVTQKPVDLDRLAEIAKIQNTRRTTGLGYRYHQCDGHSRHCPSIGRSSVLAALKKLMAARISFKQGTGRSMYYIRSDSLK